MAESLDLSGIEEALHAVASSQQSSLLSTVLSAIISGVVVFILGELSRGYWLAPLHRYKSMKEQIAYLLIHHKKWYMDPMDHKSVCTQSVVDSYNQASNAISDIAAQLFGFAETLPKFHPGIPSAKKLKEAAQALIGLSNGLYLPYGVKANRTEDPSIHITQNEKRVNEIRNILGLSKPKEKE